MVRRQTASRSAVEDGLQNPDTWEWDKAERRPRDAAGSGAVMVAFAGEDFDLVAGAAERSGMRLSEFIRAAAIEKAQGRTGQANDGEMGEAVADVTTANR